MSYGFDFSRISLDTFKEIINYGYLIPSMRVLLSNIDQNFEILKNQKITNIGELQHNIKTKKKAEVLSDETGIDLDYIIRLRRMISSYKAKPRKLIDFPDITEELVVQLREKGIKTSIELNNFLDTVSGDTFFDGLDVNLDYLNTIKSLLEVSQLRYVSPLFATVLIRSGYDSIEKIAASISLELHNSIIKVNRKYHIYKGNVGDSDAQFIIDDANVFLLYNKKEK